MPIDKFGRSTYSNNRHLLTYYKQISKNVPSRTSSGDFNFEDRKLCNVKDPSNVTDATNKRYVDDIIDSLHNELREYQKSMKDDIQNIDDMLKEYLETRINTIKTDVNTQMRISQDHGIHKIQKIRDDLNSELAQAISQVNNKITIKTGELNNIIQDLVQRMDKNNTKNEENVSLHTQMLEKVNQMEKSHKKMQNTINEMATNMAALYNYVNDLDNSVKQQQQHNDADTAAQ